MARPSPRSRRRPPGGLTFRAIYLLLAVGVGVAAWRAAAGGGAGGTDQVAAERSRAPATVTPSPSPSPAIETPAPINTAFPGLTTFRGNATRSYYGEGPVPKHPVVLWEYPESGALCGQSSVGGVPKTWCGTGWTGQPNVIQHTHGGIEVRVGAFDYDYHFLRGRTGLPARPDLDTGDLAKGSATSDPDGYPLYYAGSRDNLLRVVALDRSSPTVLWELNSETSVSNPVWNNDWDGAPLIVGDYLLEGGENSWFYVVRLHRHYDAEHLVQVDPKVVMAVPGWDDQLFADLPDQDISIESSVAFHKGVAYFGNSGGLVQGWDISDVLHGGTDYRRVFRFWTGDDTDASVVIDDEGYLYVGSEYQRFNERSREVGQIMKLDPRKPHDPLVWSIPAPAIGFEGAGGTWSTPAIYGDYVFEAIADGHLLGIDRDTGKILWQVQLTKPVVSSPVPIDDVLIQGDCGGVLRGLDISKPRRPPPELWRVQLPGCIESTPAVWRGMIYVGTRAGKIYGIGEGAGR